MPAAIKASISWLENNLKTNRARCLVILGRASYGNLKTNTLWAWPGDYNLRNGTGVEMCHCQATKSFLISCQEMTSKPSVFDPRWGQALYKLLISTCAMYCKKKIKWLFSWIAYKYWLYSDKVFVPSTADYDATFFFTIPWDCFPTAPSLLYAAINYID